MRSIHLIMCVVVVAMFALPACMSQNSCDLVRCGFGASCVMDPIIRKPRCQCPRFCPMIQDPVCANDGQLYGNTCFMNMTACRERRIIQVKRHLLGPDDVNC